MSAPVFRKTFSPISLLSVALFVGSLHAAEVAHGDPDLPQPFSFDAKALDTFREHSPFNRVVSLQDTYKLTGVAYFNGRPMATLMNRDTKQHFVVSDEPNAMGITLMGATMSDEPGRTEVHLMIGAEEVVMRYSEADAVAEMAKSPKGDSSSIKKGTSSSKSPNANALAVDVASLLGDQGRKLMGALSPEDRAKLESIMSASAAKHPERTKEQLAASAKKIYAKMTSEGKAPSVGTPKPPKAERPSKKR